MTWLGKGKYQSLDQMELLFQVGMLDNSNTLQKLTCESNRLRIRTPNSACCVDM